MRSLIWIALSSLCFAIATPSLGDESHLGIYGQPGGDLVIVTRWGEDLYLLDMVDGQARRVAHEAGMRWIYGPTRSSTEPVAGRVVFEVDAAGGAVGLVAGSPAQRLPRVPLRLTSVDFANGEAAHLAGTLVSPVGEPRAWVLYLNGEGPNPRWDGWDTAAWLGAHGIGSLLIDQRGAGDSTGDEVSGNYYTRSMTAASDAVAAMRFLVTRAETEGLPVGVAGLSQGGWLGAIVAAEVAETAFYINRAGNGSPGCGQWRHAMTTWLHRKQVPLDQVSRASAYFDAFFGLYDGKVEWDDYGRALEVARSEAWWPVMKQRYVAEWESLDEARAFAEAEAGFVPADDFRRVQVPTLGLFFEHDHSTTPETPQIFLQALRSGGNGDVTVRVFPGGDHGGWVVDGFRMDRSQITRRLTEPFEFMRDWILGLAKKPGTSP